MRRPSFPTVISLIALFVALGGTSYAVIKLPAKSVGNRELKTNAVSGSKVRPRAISRSDLALSARSGARGPRGPSGPSGPAGPSAAAVEAWQPIQLIGAWSRYSSDYAAAGVRKDAAGRVYLRGLIKRAGGPVANDTIAVLPAEFRPAVRVLVGSMMGTTANAAGRLDISPAGEIVWTSGPTGDPNYTSLDNISFWAD
jgi:hypothetical protein